MNEQSMNKLLKTKILLGQLNRAIEKREKKLEDLVRERDLIYGSAYSVDKDIKFEEVRHKISEIELALERFYPQKEDLETKIKYLSDHEYNIKKNMRDEKPFNISKFIDMLTNRYVKNNILSYDVLYNKIPPDVLSADLIDEIVNLLKQRGIKVLDKVYKEEDVGQYLGKIDEEIIAYERNIELQLNDLLKGSYVKENNISELQIVTNRPIKESTKLEKTELSITPHLPQIKDVIPKLANEISSLLISKSNARTKEKKDISLTRIESIESTILSGVKTDANYNNILPYQGPKIYSKARFDNDRRLSLYAKTVGDRAAEIVIKLLNENITSR